MKKTNPVSAIIAVTYRCNSRCIMCDIWKRKSQKEIGVSVFAKLPFGLKSIDITGGEPFLRDDLVKIISVLKKKNPKARLLITTNGFLVNKIKKTVPLLLKIDKKLAFRVSLDGMGKVHDKIRGVKGGFVKVKQTLAILTNSGVLDLGIIFTLNKYNFKDIGKVLSFCHKKDLNFSLNILHDSPIYFGSNHQRLAPDFNSAKKALNSVGKHLLLSLRPKNWLKAWFYFRTINYLKTKKRPLSCQAGKDFFYLDSFGNVYLCHFKNWQIGSLLKESFSKIWQGKKRQKYLKMAKFCQDCWMICSVKNEIIKKQKDFL